VPAEVREALKRGFNLTGWLDQSRPRRPARNVLARLRARGFSHVRLPVDGVLLMPAFASPSISERHWAELDRALDELVELGFAVSIDVHPGDLLGNQHEKDPKLPQPEDLWSPSPSATRPARPPRCCSSRTQPRAAPTPGGPYRPPRAEIRRIAPDHTLVFGPTDNQSVEALAAAKPFEDRNIVYAVHYYSPFVFTHQEWIGTRAPPHPAFLPAAPLGPARCRAHQSLAARDISLPPPISRRRSSIGTQANRQILEGVAE
jgi:endoglucanase